MQQLDEEAALVGFPRKNPVHAEELRADRRAEVPPCRALRIRRRIDWIRTNVAERARHADAIGGNSLGRVPDVAVVALGVPRLRRLRVEVRVGKQPQADDTAGVAVERSDGNRRPARADLHARMRGLVFKWIPRTIRTVAANVEP